jgi:hypothetical protein
MPARKKPMPSALSIWHRLRTTMLVVQNASNTTQNVNHESASLEFPRHKETRQSASAPTLEMRPLRGHRTHARPDRVVCSPILRPRVSRSIGDHQGARLLAFACRPISATIGYRSIAGGQTLPVPTQIHNLIFNDSSNSRGILRVE